MSAVTTVRARRLLSTLAAVGAALALPLSAGADDGGGSKASRTATCASSRTATLDLEAKDGRIQIELEVETGRPGTSWAVVLLHERRISFRGNVRTRGDGTIKLRRSVPDLLGPDAVTARATSPAGVTCRVSATLRSDDAR